MTGANGAYGLDQEASFANNARPVTVNKKTISVIALSNRAFDSLDDKLAEAVRWIEIAAMHGADLAVLPEHLSGYCGDGPGAAPLSESAVDDWQNQTTRLFEAAAQHGIAVTIPVVTREGKKLSNSFFLISREGKVLGRYQKLQPTQGELDAGVEPGEPGVIEWEGIKVGGALCFDTNFERVFSCQIRLGAQFFIAPSLWPGGSNLNYYALHFSTPIALAYPAWSRIIDIDGKEVAEGGYRHETLRFGFGIPVYTATLNFDRQRFHGDFNQDKIVDIQKRYGMEVGIVFDQQNCSFYVESLSENFTVQDVIRDFGLVPYQQYLSRFKMRGT